MPIFYPGYQASNTNLDPLDLTVDHITFKVG